MGIALELAIPSRAEMARRGLRSRIKINDFVDSVLRVLLEASTSPEGNGSSPRRRIIFSSFSADLCAAVNWKQPNCESHLLHMQRVVVAHETQTLSSLPHSAVASALVLPVVLRPGSQIERIVARMD